MKDLLTETLREVASKSKVNIKAVQRYLRMKFNMSIDEDVLSRRIKLIQK